MEAYNASALRLRMEDEKLSDVISIGSCSDKVSCSLVEIQPEAQGRIVEINVRVRRRGMKAMTLPAHHEASCRDIIVEGVRFVLPEDVSLASEESGGCGERRFRVRTHVHYMDANDICGCT